MRILDRYLIRHFLYPLLFCILFFLIIFIVIDCLDHLDGYLKHGVSLGIVLTYYLYLLPSVIVQIVPIAALVSILFTLGNFNKHNEIAAIKASGVSAFQIIAPYLFVGMILSFGIFLINESLVPKTIVTSTAIREGLIEKGKKKFEDRSIKNVTLYSKDRRMIFAREYEVLHQTLYDVVILEDQPGDILKTKMIAEKAEFQNDRWVFTRAIKYKLNWHGEMIGEPSFSEKLTLELPERPDDFIREASQVEFMNSKELKQYIEHLQGMSKKLIQRLWVEFHNKVAISFVSLIVILVGAPLAMMQKRGGSTLIGIGTSLVIVSTYYGLDSIFLALGRGGHLPAFFAAWFGNLFFLAIGLYLIKNTT